MLLLVGIKSAELGGVTAGEEEGAVGPRTADERFGRIAVPDIIDDE